MLETYTFSLPGALYLLCPGRAGKGFSKPELLWSSSRTLITHNAVCYNADAWHWTLWLWYHFLALSAATYRGIWRYKSAQDDTQTASQDLNIKYYKKTCRVKLHQWVVITCVNITPSSLPALTTNSISANTHLIEERGEGKKSIKLKSQTTGRKSHPHFWNCAFENCYLSNIIIPRFAGWQRGNLWQKAQTLKLCFPCVLAMTRSSRVVNCASGMLSRYLRFLWIWKLSDNQLNENGQWKCRDEENIPV